MRAGSISRNLSANNTTITTLCDGILAWKCTQSSSSSLQCLGKHLDGCGGENVVDEARESRDKLPFWCCWRAPIQHYLALETVEAGHVWAGVVTLVRRIVFPLSMELLSGSAAE